MIRRLFICLIGLTFLFQSGFTDEANTVVRFSKQTDIRQISEVTAEDINKHLNGVLAGKGEVFLKAQEEHGVNAIFLASVAVVESGNGRSKMARSHNNVFGMKGKTFKNVDDCIMHAGYLFAESPYYMKRGKYTIHQIQKVYAPNYDAATNKTWSAQVVTVANRIQS